MKFEFGNNIERHPYRPLPEAEKQGLTEEEIFQKEYGLYTDLFIAESGLINLKRFTDVSQNRVNCGGKNIRR